MDAEAGSASFSAGWRGSGRILVLALTVLLGALCSAAVVSITVHQSPFSEYLLHARKCAEQNDCAAAPASIDPLRHGRIWIRLMSHALRNGYNQTYVQSVVFGATLVSLAVMFVFLRRYVGARAAALAIGLYVPLVLVGADFGSLNYPNLLPLPLAVYYATSALLVERRRLVFAALGSIALGVAVSVELGCIIMLPFHIFLAAAVLRRPVSAAIVSCLAFAIPYCWDSMASAVLLLQNLVTFPVAFGLLICVSAVALLLKLAPGVMLSSSVPTSHRLRGVMAVALVYATSTVCVAALFLTHEWPQPRYFAPAMFPLLYLVAEAAGALTNRAAIALAVFVSLSLTLLYLAPQGLDLLGLPVMVIVVLYAVLAVRSIPWRIPRPREALWPAVLLVLCTTAVGAGGILIASQRSSTQAITLAEAEELVHQLYAAGYTYAEMLSALQGPAADDLMSILMQRDPDAFAVPPPLSIGDKFSILVLKVNNTAIGRTRGMIAAVPTDGSRSLIAVRGERSYLDWTHMRRCAWTIEQLRPASYDCSQPRADQPVPRNWPYVEFTAPVPVAGPAPPVRLREYWSVHFEVPVHTPGRVAPHIVRVADEWPATWQITHADGVRVEGTLPATQMRLPDDREATGTVEFEFRGLIPGDCPWVWVPNVLEVSDGNAHLLEPFQAR